MEHTRQLRIFIYARILVTFLFLVSAVALIIKEPEAINELPYVGVIHLMAFSFLFSFASYFLSKVKRFQFFVTYLQTIWDILFVTVLLLFTGGVTSPYSFLYLLSIMSSGALLGRKEAFYTASLCGILYGAINDLQLFGYLEGIGLSQVAAQQVGPTRILYNIFMNLIGFFLTAIITGHLSVIARKSEEALEEKNINYKELQRINSTIISSIESGFLTVTKKGNIRVFNPYAEVLTGKKLADVYNAPLNTVFPGISQGIGDMSGAVSGEFYWSVPDGERRILGYSAFPFTDTNGELAGAVVNFKDLTDKRKMQEAVKRSEKLAALGELSARIAHEIRNPLASMSGSVQLLADQGSVTGSDRRLLSIILRETERLNNLITNFLTYARPASPNKEKISFHGLVEEIRMLLSADHRFNNINLINNVSEDMTIMADGHQMRQVMVNLLHNSADAIKGSGEIVVKAQYESVSRENSVAENAIITVIDNGQGITDDTAVHLFEPFWTTKSDGTGLGLAIIYRIIDEHGGHIRAESPPDGGCRMEIRLPV